MMLLDQILVMCLLLIGSHGNMSPDSKITRSKGPSDAMSLPRGTHPNTGQGVNQAQTHSGLDSRLQALVSLGTIRKEYTQVMPISRDLRTIRSFLQDKECIEQERESRKFHVIRFGSSIIT